VNGKQMDRAVGALLGAAGDALGVPYEFGSRTLRPDEPAQMLGGGLGGIAPGQWSDDTEMACAIAEVAATGADLRTQEALDRIAARFLDWYATSPPDIGVQTRQVLARTSPGEGAAARMRVVSEELHARTGRTAGNGSLMRTSPVALAQLGDPSAITQAARVVSALTHFDPMAGDACALWCIAIDHAVSTGELDLRAGLRHVDPMWADLVDEAERRKPAEFAPNNGWVVAAMQAAWSSIVRSTTLEQTLADARTCRRRHRHGRGHRRGTGWCGLRRQHCACPLAPRATRLARPALTRPHAPGRPRRRQWAVRPRRVARRTADAFLRRLPYHHRAAPRRPRRAPRRRRCPMTRRRRRGRQPLPPGCGPGTGHR